MGFVEHQEVEARVGKQADVLLACQEQLELLHVGEQNTRLPARRPHYLAGANFLGRVHAFAVRLGVELGELAGT